MKHLKRYESINDKPQTGDYVLCKTSYGAKRIDDFLKNTIGVCLGKAYIGHNIELREKLKDIFKVKYDNIPDNLKDDYFFNNIRSISRNEIIHFSPNKEDLEEIITANKYNL